MMTEEQKKEYLDWETKRKEECPQRASGSCHLVNGEIGWVHGMGRKTCDECFALGGEKGGEEFRTGKVKEWIEYVKKNLHGADRHILKVVKEKYMKAEEFEAAMSNPEVVFAAHRAEAWANVKPTWEMAESFIRSMMSRGLAGNKVELTVKGERHVSCFGTTLEGERVQEPCPSLMKSDDGVHHYCNACKCGDKKLARLDEKPFDKLDYPYLECAREMRGFSNFNDGSSSGIVDRVVCISLDRRRDRWERFERNIRTTKWPFGPVLRFRAVDGPKLPQPVGWKEGGGTWGCLQSHRQVLERAIMDDVKCLMVLEDDAVFAEGFREKVFDFLKKVPRNWDALMLGGQHIGQPKVNPIRISDGVYKCLNCQRTHGYLIRGNLLRTFYKTLVSWKPDMEGHTDKIMGPLFSQYNVYAPDPFLIGQDEGRSDISGKVLDVKWWPRMEVSE